MSSLLSFQDVAKSISQLKEKLEGFCIEEVEKISNAGKVPVAHSFTLRNKSGIMKHVEESKHFFSFFFYGNCNYVCLFP